MIVVARATNYTPDELLAMDREAYHALRGMVKAHQDQYGSEMPSGGGL